MHAEAPIRVVIADDSYIIREFLTTTLSRVPDVELIAVCSNGLELRSAIKTWSPQVVVTDIRMPPGGSDDGISIAAWLRDFNPDIGVVVLTQYAEPSYALALLEKGTDRRAYLLKESVRKREELVGAIRSVARGRSVVDPLIVDVLIQARARARDSHLSRLTARERQVLAEIASGKSNAAIGESLFLTKRAVEKHVNAIFFKLDLPEAQDVSRRVKAALIHLADDDEEPVGG
jgi:DNA-binding NarL/FixJ family response regulator